MHARPISSADPTRHSRSPVRVLGGSLLQGLLSQHQQKLENIWDNCFQTLNSSEQRFRIHKRRETIQVGLKTLQCTSWKQFPGHREGRMRPDGIWWPHGLQVEKTDFWMCTRQGVGIGESEQERRGRRNFSFLLCKFPLKCTWTLWRPIVNSLIMLQWWRPWGNNVKGAKVEPKGKSRSTLNTCQESRFGSGLKIIMAEIKDFITIHKKATQYGYRNSKPQPFLSWVERVEI